MKKALKSFARINIWFAGGLGVAWFFDNQYWAFLAGVAYALITTDKMLFEE